MNTVRLIDEGVQLYRAFGLEPADLRALTVLGISNALGTLQDLYGDEVINQGHHIDDMVRNAVNAEDDTARAIYTAQILVSALIDMAHCGVGETLDEAHDDMERQNADD